MRGREGIGLWNVTFCCVEGHRALNLTFTLGRGALCFGNLRFCGMEGPCPLELYVFAGFEGGISLGTFRFCGVEGRLASELYFFAGKVVPMAWNHTLMR